ncbi:MAG: hypothetical protein GY800_12575 [Planctomycetes bacterium]|nr:hypothetical protein [Planctomycetota bacterium]
MKTRKVHLLCYLSILIALFFLPSCKSTDETQSASAKTETRSTGAKEGQSKGSPEDSGSTTGEAHKKADAAYGYTKDKAHKAAEGTKETASDAYEYTKEGAHKAAEGTKETASDAYEYTKEGAHKAAEGTKETASDAYEYTKEKADAAQKAVQGEK